MTLGQAGSVADGDAISRRAYELFASRGYEHGQDVADWLAAEAEVRGKSRTRRAAANKGNGNGRRQTAPRSRKKAR